MSDTKDGEKEETPHNVPKELETEKFLKFYNDKKFKENEPETAKNYREVFFRLEEWFESHEEIDSWEDFDEYNVAEFVEFLRNDGLFGLTIERYLDKVSGFAQSDDREAISEEIREYEFTSKTLQEEVTGDAVKYLEIPDYKKIVDACESTVEELIIRSLWETGVRRTELAELTIQRVKRDEQLYKVHTKKNDDTRKIPYSPELKPVLQEWLDYGGRDQYGTADNSNRLIINMHSGEVTGGWINDVVRRVSDRAGVGEVYTQDAKGRDLHFPTCRHFRNSYATHRVANGLSLEKLRELMGHHSVEVTSKYVGVKTDQLREDNERYRPKTYDVSDEVARNL